MWTDSSVLSDDFDETGYLRHSLHLPNFEAEQNRLNRCSEVVQQNIRALVTDNTEVLLAQVDAATKSEKSISEFRSTVSSLGSSLKRLKHAVEDPHTSIQASVNELQRTMRAVETLRLLQKFLNLVQKLPELVQSDVGRAARSLRDVEEILGSNQLHGIDAAERHFDSVTKLSAAVRSKAHELLKSSMTSQNQADAAAAMQCFLSLGSLHKVVANLIAEHKRELTKIVMRELDAQAIAQVIEQSSAPGESNKIRDVVFTKLDLVFGEVIHRLDSIMLLWKILQKKKDPISHEPFHSAIKDGPALLSDLWTSISQLLHEKLSKLYKRGSFFLMIVGEYPRFYGLLRSLVNSVGDLIGASGDRESGQRWLLATTDEPEKRFVGLSQERHRDKMQQITVRLTTLIPTAGSESMHLDIAVDPARPQLPSAVTALDTKGLLKVLQQDVNAFRQDSHVLSLVLHQGIGSLSMLWQRLQEALSKTGVPQQQSLKNTFEGTASQVFRFCIANAATSVYSDLGSILSLLPAESGPEVNKQVIELKAILRTFQDIVHTIIEPYFAGACETLSVAVASVVNDVSGEDSGLQRFTVTVGSVVSRFVLLLDRSTPGLEDEENKLVESLLRSTLAASLLVRPLDPVTVSHLVRCLVQVPQIVATIPHLPTPSTNHWRNQIKALKSMVAASEDSAQFEAHIGSVNPIVMLLHLSQRIAMSSFPSIGRTSGLGDRKVVEAVCDALIGSSIDARKLVLEWVGKGFREYESVSLGGSDEANLRRWHLESFQGLRNSVAGTL